ncbi:fructose-6-phosphate-2-kinase/fructose-2,6-bisphosphatase [Zea mays]|uniref:6-phosphofructo-2-kinase/fructose-26-bisphosphatase n=1 Tax=Zea mays TaxID=4577 RepID=B4F8N3_MAIZE|nr:fructose-6-phosphate-2-kinase/fructose-2,6-bisphosphatase [Zea mays]ACF78476.1 unknown [Zea mays]AQK84217.1 6-phosphofructo-2-kinase/fructose-26-bisphosphatase [Zea mays]|eukprot:NP_001105044.2 fructose-6-phosphate-2-kinase/fructose-2,6-bisphosphatase [Zea mays]
MGTSGSKGIDGVGAVSGVGAGAAGLGGVGAGGDGGEGAAAEAWHGGAQLYVSLKMENALISGDLVPHVYGSEPIIGTWDPSRALAMERELASMWVLSFVVPPDHETLDFKFLLKPKDAETPCIIEEGPTRLLTGGMLEGDVRVALFKLNGDDEVLEFGVVNKADLVSPLELAASWRVYKENFQPSKVRGIPDISINVTPTNGAEEGSAATLELDLEHYVVPSPPTAPPNGYAANLAATPASVIQTEALLTNDILLSDGIQSPSSVSAKLEDCTNHKNIEAWATDSSKKIQNSGLIESKSVGTFTPMQKLDGQKGLFVDRGVGSSMLPKSASACSLASGFSFGSAKTMPEAAGAVAAAAVADRLHGSKEDRKLAIVLVGLPARGKTFTAVKLTRYLRWLGHETRHFNVGKYRRLKLGANQSADFFRDDNPEGIEARNEVAALAMEDMIDWMNGGGQVGIFDATNSTRKRRYMLMKMAEGNCKIIFLETICNDPNIIERNIRLKIQQSPDYAEQLDYEAGLEDFKERLINYEKVYEPVGEGSYIKMIDMVKGQDGQLQVNNISGYLPGRIVFFLVNSHLTPRPILLTRHGESLHNVRGRVGGDTVLSETGELYAKKLANFIEKRLKCEKTATIWTSTLQRTILTASPIVGFPKIQWRALDEINSGVCDGMTYEEIKKIMPEEFESRKKDKLRYRYPRGESYLDVIQRLEPVIIELERQRAPVVVISHQAVLRALYAYFADRPLREVPEIEMPLHTIIEIQMGVTGVEEKRYKLMD